MRAQTAPPAGHLQGPAQASLLGGKKSSSKAEGPCAYLDVSSAQALLSTNHHLPAYRGQSAAGGQRCRSPDRGQQRAQTATCAGQGDAVARTTGCGSAANTGCAFAGRQPEPQLGIERDGSSSTAPPGRRPRWDGSVSLPREPTFSEALLIWQRDVEKGVYAPKLLGSITAVTSGKVKPARSLTRPTSPCKSRLKPSAGQQTQKRTATITTTATDNSSNEGATPGGPGSSSSPCTGSGAAAVTPAVFQGSGENALLALEGLVARHVVTKPHLTLMQLQRTVRDISQLDSQCQLAAISVLVKAGYWLAAMQVAYAEGLCVLCDVPLEMRAIIDMGLHWDSQAAAATWSWAPVDRALFLHTFRASDLTLQYLQLRKQLTRLQQLQLAAQQQQQRQQQRTALAPYNGLGGSSSSVSALRAGVHPELAQAERVLLIGIIDSYLQHLAAVTAAATAASAAGACDEAAAAAAAAAPPPTSSRPAAGLVGCYAGFQDDAPLTARVKQGKGKRHRKHKSTKQHSSSSGGLLGASASTMHISSDWRIHLENEQDAHSTGEESDSSSTTGSTTGSSSSSSSSSNDSSSTSSMSNHDGASISDCTAAAGGHTRSPVKADTPPACVSADTAAAAGEAREAVPQPQQQQTQQQQPSPLTPPSQVQQQHNDMTPQAPVQGTQGQVQQRQSAMPLPMQQPPPQPLLHHQQQQGAQPEAPAPPLQPCSRPQSHQPSRRASTAHGSRPGTAQHGIAAIDSESQQQQQQQQQQQWPPAVGSILAFPGSSSLRHTSSGNGSTTCTDEHSHSIPGNTAEALLLLSPSATAVAAAGGRLRPASAASGLSRVSQPGSSSSTDAIPRPGSAATGSLRQMRILEGVAVGSQSGDAGDGGLQRFRDVCAQHRQDLQQRADGNSPVAAAGVDSPTAAAAAVKSKLSQADSRSNSRPASASVAAALAAATGRPVAAAAGSGAGGAGGAVAGALGKLAGAAGSGLSVEFPSRPASGSTALSPGLARISSGSTSTSSGSRPASAAANAAVPAAGAQNSSSGSPNAAAAGGNPPCKSSSRPSSSGADSQPCLPVNVISSSGSRRHSAASAQGSRRHSVASAQGRCSEASYGGDLLLSSSKGLLDPQASGEFPDEGEGEAGTSEQGPSSSCRSGRSQSGTDAMQHRDSASTSAAAAAGPAAGQRGSLDSASPGATLAGQLNRRSSSPVPHLPLLEAGLLAADDEAACNAEAAKRHKRSSTSAAVAGAAAAAPGGAASSGADGRWPHQPAAARPKSGAGLKSTGGASTTAASYATSHIGHKPAAAAAAGGAAATAAATKKRAGFAAGAAAGALPKSAAAALAVRVAAIATATVDKPVTAVGPATASKASNSAAHQPATKHSAANGQAQEAAQADSDTAASMASSSYQGPEQADAVNAMPAPGAAAAADSTPAATAPEPAALHAAAAAKVVLEDVNAMPQHETPPAPAAAAATAETEEVAASSQDAAAAAACPCDDEATTGPAGQAATAAEGQLMVELTQTMQQFQQQLQQTALMAQQLLAQQLAGQAAREVGPGTNSSSSSSRPGSAAARARRLSQTNGSRSGSRPGSRGQQQQLSGPGSGGGGIAGAGTQGVLGPSLYLGPDLAQLEGVLEVDEPPSAVEVQAYARYLGMDPVQDVDLLYIAEEALLAPVAPGWTVHLDAAQNEFFHNTTTGESTYEHPMDNHYRQMYQQKRLERQQGQGQKQQ